MAFTDEELEYLRSQPLARLATVAPDGQPDVTPVALEVEGRIYGTAEDPIDRVGMVDAPGHERLERRQVVDHAVPR